MLGAQDDFGAVDAAPLPQTKNKGMPYQISDSISAGKKRGE
jgi:hypothetical protein